MMMVIRLRHTQLLDNLTGNLQEAQKLNMMPLKLPKRKVLQ
jgi:hypothetical protein